MPHLRIALITLLLSSHCLAADTIRICAENDWQPFSFSKKGQAVGASVDLIRAAFAKEGIETLFISGSYNRCLKLTLAGQYDAMLDVGKNQERLPQFIWPQTPFIMMNLHLIANHQQVQHEVSYRVLSGKRIGITAGYEYPDKMLSQAGILKVESSSELANLRQLAAGRIDFMLLSEGTFANLSKQLSSAERKAVRDWGLVDQLGLYLAFSPKASNASRWAKAFDRGLNELQKKGEDRQIFARWSAVP
ncbi:substrate-binding periplasmic protein [Chitinibacter sp. S2-10]|uniref:substrate-binding periplasmic protein n=1 Tax=Chitinibacter sp. S2-10 TaxID=3373597 RepID=UPI0039776BB6